MFTKNQRIIIGFNILYLLLGGVYFLQDFNHEFVIYVAVIIAILAGVFASLKYSKFSDLMLWALSLWGLAHVLGGAVQTADGVLFAYRIYPFLDWGGEFYILKYDQVVHAYLYGLVAVMAYHLLRNMLQVKKFPKTVFLVAIMASVGVSAMNEIMEFIIAMTLERNGVGGYENAMLDFVFNLSGAVIALSAYVWWKHKQRQTVVTLPLGM